MEIPTVAPSAAVQPKPTFLAKTFRLALVLCVLITTLTVVAYPFLQPVVPIFYTFSQPERQLLSKIWIILFPAFAWIVTLTHFILLKSYRAIAETIQPLLAWTTVGIISIAGLLLVRLVLITI